MAGIRAGLFGEIVAMSIDTLRTNKMRSALTVLDFAQHGDRASDAICKFFTCEFESIALSAKPFAKRNHAFKL